MTRFKSSRSPARDRILATASELFYKEGIRNVGVDRIIAESGVAKMSLYKHFKSKDALIATWLQQQGEAWQAWFQARVEDLATAPRDRLLAVFDVLKEWFEQSDFRGCASINSSIELVNPEHPGYQACSEHKQVMADYLYALVRATELPQAEALAQQLRILVEGAIIVAMMQGNSKPALQAKQAAIALIESSRT